MRKTIRNFLSNVWLIHFLVLLGLFALWGYIELGNKYLLLCMALSYSGALCGSFTRIIDAIDKKCQ